MRPESSNVQSCAIFHEEINVERFPIGTHLETVRPVPLATSVRLVVPLVKELVKSELFSSRLIKDVFYLNSNPVVLEGEQFLAQTWPLDQPLLYAV
jgi:hypothetical protein